MAVNHTPASAWLIFAYSSVAGAAFLISWARKNSTGNKAESVVHSGMDKGFSLAAAAILVTCVSVSGQERMTLEPISVVNARLASAPRRAESKSSRPLNLAKTYAAPAPLSLIDNDPFTFMDAFAWTALTPPFVLSPLSVPNPALLASAPLGSQREGQSVAVQSNSNYAWGELGGLYGTTVGGKSSLEIKQGYITGGLGNERTQVTVGASYSNWKGSLPGNFR